MRVWKNYILIMSCILYDHRRIGLKAQFFGGRKVSGYVVVFLSYTKKYIKKLHFFTVLVIQHLNSSNTRYLIFAIDIISAKTPAAVTLAPAP